jgi:hypothetical protein
VAADAMTRAVVSRMRPRVTVACALATGASAESRGRPRHRVTADHEALVYQLLDAHADTADPAAEPRSEPRWAAHLDDLRALQRKGRQTLAQISMENQT